MSDYKKTIIYKKDDNEIKVNITITDEENNLYNTKEFNEAMEMFDKKFSNFELVERRLLNNKWSIKEIIIHKECDDEEEEIKSKTR